MKNRILKTIILIGIYCNLPTFVYADIPVMQFPIVTPEQANPGFTGAQAVNQLVGQALHNQQQAIINRYSEAILQEKLRQAQLETQRLQNEAQSVSESNPDAHYEDIDNSYSQNTQTSYQKGFKYLNDNEPDKAIPYLIKAANAGGHSAQFALATAYFYSVKIKEHYAKAFYWYKKVDKVEKDRILKALCEERIGLMFFYGVGVKKNGEMAVRYFYQAARRGNARSQTMLGALYHDGIYVPFDPAQSCAWAGVSLANKDVYSALNDEERGVAQKCLNEMYSSLTPNQKSSAEQLFREYFRNYVEPFMKKKG